MQVLLSINSKWKSLSSFYKYLLAEIGYVIVFAFIYFVEYALKIIKVVPTNQNVLAWDAGWYNSIRTNGYEYIYKKASSTGFFPLVPYLWRWMHLTNSGICLFMLAVSLLAIAWLSSFFKPGWPAFFIALSFPTLFYFALPYTEALFFLFSVMAIIGWHKKNHWLLITGLFLASLTRVSVIFLVGGMVFAEMLRCESFRDFLSRVNRIIVLVITVTAGITTVLVVQYQQTHIWNAYFKTQSESWDRTFKWPTFPMGSTEGGKVLWIQLFGLWLGIACFFILIKILYLRMKRSKINNPVFIASITCLFLTMLSEIFFNPTWWNIYSASGTWLVGLARYMFVNAFFFVFVFHLFSHKRIKYTIPGVLFFFIGACAVYLLITDNTMKNDHTWLRYLMYVTLGLLLYFMAYTFPKTRLWVIIIIIQLLLQVYYAGSLLNGLSV